MQPSGEIGRFQMDDQPSPPADRNRYPIEAIATQTMHTLCCQIQIDKLETLTEQRIICLCHNLSDKMPSVTFESGDDNGRYVNLFIDSDDAADAWSLIRASLLSDRLIGVEMRAASIVTMTGQNGWDDYLLLHHFDQTQTLDTI